MLAYTTKVLFPGTTPNNLLRKNEIDAEFLVFAGNTIFCT